MKFSVLLLLSIVIACSGGGGGGKEPQPKIEYKTVYIYPENTLQSGEGTVEVDALDAVCFDNKGNEVDILNCVVDIPNAPKEVQKSPAGSAVVDIDNSNEGQITIEFAEGESWLQYEDSRKKELAEGRVSCLTGFDLTFRGSCESYNPEFRYGPWPENDMVACSAIRTVIRDSFCRSNITGEDISETECSTLIPDISTNQLSPAGLNEVTLSNGDKVTLNCRVGVGEDGIALGDTFIVTSHECGEDRHMANLACVADTFDPVNFDYEELNLTAGQGVHMADAVAVTECRRQHSGELVDPSKCSIPVEVPQIPVSSPAGTIQVTVEGSDTPVTVIVGEGQTWAEVPVEEKVSQLEGNVVCNGGTLLAHTAQCLAPSYSAVLGDYHANPLSACEGKVTIYQSHQCLYNITGQLTDDYHCPNTSEGMEVLSPSGTKENVTLANGDVVNLLCADGGTPSDVGTTASILTYHTCGEDRYLNNSVCVPEIFTPTQFGFTDPDPALQIGDGELVVDASSVTECRRISDNNTVDTSKCVLPETLPTQTLLSPAGDLEGVNLYGDRIIFALNEGEVLSDASEQKSIVSCSELRVDDGTGKSCRYLGVAKIDITRGGSTPYISLIYDNGGSMYLDRNGGTSQYPVIYNAFMSASTKATDPSSTSFIHTTDNKLIFRVSNTEVRVVDNVYKYFATDLGIIIVNEAGAGSWISDYNGATMTAPVNIASVNFNTMTFVYCHNSYMNYGDGCMLMNTSKAITNLGTGVNAYTYNYKSYSSGGMYVNEPTGFANVTAQITNVKQLIKVNSRSLLLLKNDGAVVFTGEKNTVNASNQLTPSEAFVPTVIATGVSQLFRVNGENFAKKTDGTLRRWKANTVTTIFSGLDSNEAKSVGNKHVLYNDGTLVTNFTLPAGVPTTGIKEVSESPETTTIITEDKHYYMILGDSLVKSGSFVEIAHKNILEGIFVKGSDGTWVSVKHDDSEINYVDPRNATNGKFLNPSILDPTVAP